MWCPKNTMDIRSFYATKEYSTHRFKHENNPQLAEMRTDWLRRYEEHMDSPKGTFSKEWRKSLFKEQTTLWSHRALMHYD